MQIRTQLNDECPHSTRQNVVQKIFETSDARQNESRLKQSTDINNNELMYIQVSSNCSDLHKNHFKWSLCSIDKFKSHCSFLIKYLLVNWFLLSYGKRFYFVLSKCFQRCRSIKCKPLPPTPPTTEAAAAAAASSSFYHHRVVQTSALVYIVQHQVVIENSHLRMEPAHKSLMIDKSFMLLSMHCTNHQHFKSSIFYMKLYKVLLNLFYESFNNKMNCHQPPCRYRHHHHHHHHYHNHHHQPNNKIYLNPQSSINMFCDLSTNSKSGESRNILFLINEMSGIEHHQRQNHQRYLVRLSSLYIKLRTLNFLFRILLIQRHVMCNNSYEFSDNHNVNVNNGNGNGSVRHYSLIHLLKQDQMVLCVTSTWQCNDFQRQQEMKFQMPDDKSCHGIENGISTLATTSNHKLKATAQDDNDTCHHESEKFSNCYQQFHRTFRSNDSVKSHLNAILFLIILCIPLLTAASSVHNLKYSTNVVKTKYGPLRGIILRSTPTVEGYFGVPYGESLYLFHKLFSLTTLPLTSSNSR